jgi:hypothetical protein
MGAMYVECSSKERPEEVDEVFALAVNTVVGIEEQGWNNRALRHGGGGKKLKKRSCKML